MIRAQLPFVLVVLAACADGPGIIGATVESGAGQDGSTTTPSDASTGASMSSTSAAETTTDADDGADAADTAAPRLDVDNTVDCNGPCGYESTCGGVVGPRALAVAMWPGPRTGYISEQGADAQLVFDIGPPYSDGTELPETPAGYAGIDVAADANERMAVLVKRADGYEVERRAPPTYEIDWVRADSGAPGIDAMRTATEIAAADDGTIFVTGLGVDSVVGPTSTELFLDAYAADGTPLASWTEGGVLSVAPRFVRDWVAGDTLIWAEVELDGEVAHHGWARRLDATGEVIAAHDVPFVLPIVDRPSRRTNGWVAVAPEADGLALLMLDEDFELLDVVHHAPPRGRVLSPLHVIVVDDGMVVFVAYSDGSLSFRMYDASGMQAPYDEVDDYLPAFGPMQVVDLAADFDGHVSFLMGEAAGIGDAACRFDFLPD